MAYTNNLTARYKLHHQLIDVENKPCSNPDCQTPYDRREIHRIIHGGEYCPDNVLVRCFSCHHFIDHPNSKFRVGDRIVLNGRTPAYIDLARHRPRTIIAVRYDPRKQCNFYRLGAGNTGADGNPLDGYTDYEFRSYMLLKPRRYHYHRKYIYSTNDKRECHQRMSVNSKLPSKTKIGL